MKNQFHPKYQQKYFWNSALKCFVASWGLLGDLVSKEAIKTFRAEILTLFSLLFFYQKDISKLTDL